MTGEPDLYFRSVVEANPDCVRLLSLEGRVEFMNAHGLALCEIDDFERFKGAYWPDFWPKSMRPQVEEALQAAREGETRSFRGRCLTAKGGERWWHVIVSPVQAEGDGRPTKLIAHSRDVTGELQTRSLLDAIVRNVPAILFAKEAETGRYVLMNRAAETSLGLAPGAGLGKSCFDVFPPELARLQEQYDQKVLTSGRPHTVVESRDTPTGKRWFRSTKVAVRDEEGVEHLVGIAEDITESVAARETLEHALERAEGANRAKSEFLATISHEIRTPLNGVIGMAHAMANDPLPPEQRERLRVIRRSGETLLSILNDLLDLSKIEAGKLELEQEDFDLEHMVRGAGATFAAVASAKQVAFEIVIDDEVKGGYRGDATRIRRLIFNLLSNAVKFTDKGSVRLLVARENGSVVFRVIDTGIGVGPEQLPFLFDKFVQADASYSRRFGGSGLGLSICRGLAELMGGTVEADSVLGQGSVFTVVLPLEAIGKGGASVRETPPPASPARPWAPRVLAAEDNEVNQQVLRILLGQADITPHMVENGLQALQAWEAEPWDLILMDIQMPELDGLSATQAIRAREAQMDRARTPIIALTANAMDHQAESYRAAGMDQVVSKPLRPEELFTAIDQALRSLDPETADRGSDRRLA